MATRKGWEVRFLRGALERPVALLKGEIMDKVGVISYVERLGVIAYGNPYYCVHFEDGTHNRTQINVSINYSIENSDNLGVKVGVKLTKAGRIYDIKAV